MAEPKGWNGDGIEVDQSIIRSLFKSTQLPRDLSQTNALEHFAPAGRACHFPQLIIPTRKSN